MVMGECVHACGVCVCKLITAWKEENWNSIAKCVHTSINTHIHSGNILLHFESVLVFSIDLGVPVPWQE